MKFIPYGHQNISQKDIQRVVKVLNSDWITQGQNIAKFENALCRYTGAKYAVAVSSGTAALHIACLAAGIKQKDEVITSPITFSASANCILYCGGTPIFADIQKDTVNIDPEKMSKCITKKTKAIIPVHFAGLPCDIEDIFTIAKKNKLIIIEDACHALGAEYKFNNQWIKIGCCKHSDMAVFSFHPVKTITTGEGGAVLTNNKAFYNKLVSLRSHGIYKNAVMKKKYGPWYYEIRNLGFNYRITDFQCALGMSQLEKINDFLKQRRNIVNIYNDKLSQIDLITLPFEPTTKKSSWHIYYLQLKKSSKRKHLFNELMGSNIGVQVHYIPVYFHPFYKRLGFKKGLCPNAENYYASALTIPLYNGLKSSQIRYVISCIFKALNKL